MIRIDTSLIYENPFLIILIFQVREPAALGELACAVKAPDAFLF